ncbi:MULTISPECIES: phage regulatory CII family protein [unclassified Burkholderia]|uniref:phage regulatory CII family protein n=1 Tax=unclassified Burkholderia TaxID=2613784 RepID=UPI0016398726|nr:MULTISPECIES: phage regulatory CII family protein [unclassified Burkholderia]
MTCRYSGTDWLDVLYTSIRNTPGGVSDAALFLTARRGRSISVEALRLRLRAVDENRLSMEMFVLLLKWMEEHGSPHALDALYALNEQFGLRTSEADAEPSQDSSVALIAEALKIATHTGEVAESVRVALEDNVISEDEATTITTAARAQQRALDRLIQHLRTVVRSPKRLFVRD